MVVFLSPPARDGNRRRSFPLTNPTAGGNANNQRPETDEVQDVKGRAIGRRGGVALVTFACLLGQLSSLAHGVLVQHVICAEHGESIHLRSMPAGRADSVRQLEGGVARARAAVPMAEADEHDHCSLVASRNLRPQSTEDFTAGPALVGSSALARRELVAIPIIPAYLIAPKTSPPKAVQSSA